MSLSYSAAANFLSGDVHDIGRQLGTNASLFLIGRTVRSFIDRQELDIMRRAVRFAHRHGPSELFTGEDRNHAGRVRSTALRFLTALVGGHSWPTSDPPRI